jgi:hypothetical protein
LFIAKIMAGVMSIGYIAPFAGVGVLILPIRNHLRCLVVVGFGVEYGVLLVEDFSAVAKHTKARLILIPRRGGVQFRSGG